WPTSGAEGHRGSSNPEHGRARGRGPSRFIHRPSLGSAKQKGPSRFIHLVGCRVEPGVGADESRRSAKQTLAGGGTAPLRWTLGLGGIRGTSPGRWAGSKRLHQPTFRDCESAGALPESFIISL